MKDWKELTLEQQAIAKEYHGLERRLGWVRYLWQRSISGEVTTMDIIVPPPPPPPPDDKPPKP
jgi:hypothetical protein